LLGKLVSPGIGARENRHQLVSATYFQLLAEHGLLRDDLGVDEIGYAFLATSWWNMSSVTSRRSGQG
jgi:hypothetical protein